MNEIEKWERMKKVIVKGLAIYAVIGVSILGYFKIFHSDFRENKNIKSTPVNTEKHEAPNDISRYVGFTKEVVFDDESAGFTIQVPKTWSVEYPPGKGRDGPAVIVTRPAGRDKEQFLENCNVMIGAWTKQVDESQLRLAHQRAQAGLKQITKDFKEIAKNETKVGSLSAMWSITSFTPPGAPAQTKNIGYMIAHAHERLIFSVICTALPTTFSLYEQTFRNIAMSFRVTGE